MVDKLAEYLMESDRRKNEWEMEREKRQEERAAGTERRLVEQERRHIDGMNRMGAMMALMASGKAGGKGRALFTGGVEGAALEDATEAWADAADDVLGERRATRSVRAMAARLSWRRRRTQTRHLCCKHARSTTRLQSCNSSRRALQWTTLARASRR